MSPSPYLSPAEVMQHFGITSMTLWRWSHDQKLGFPKPMVIRRRNFFLLSEIEQWEKRQREKRQIAARA